MIEWAYLVFLAQRQRGILRWTQKCFRLVLCGRRRLARSRLVMVLLLGTTLLLKQTVAHKLFGGARRLENDLVSSIIRGQKDCLQRIGNARTRDTVGDFGMRHGVFALLVLGLRFSLSLPLSTESESNLA